MTWAIGDYGVKVAVACAMLIPFRLLMGERDLGHTIESCRAEPPDRSEPATSRAGPSPAPAVRSTSPAIARNARSSRIRMRLRRTSITPSSCWRVSERLTVSIASAEIACDVGPRHRQHQLVALQSTAAAVVEEPDQERGHPLAGAAHGEQAEPALAVVNLPAHLREQAALHPGHARAQPDTEGSREGCTPMRFPSAMALDV